LVFIVRDFFTTKSTKDTKFYQQIIKMDADDFYKTISVSSVSSADDSSSWFFVSFAVNKIFERLRGYFSD